MRPIIRTVLGAARALRPPDGAWVDAGNLLQHPHQFDQWLVGASGATVSSDQVVAPDGTRTADLVTFADGSSYLYKEHAASVTAGEKCSIKLYAKSMAQIVLFGGATPAGTDVYSLIGVGKGWYQQKITRTFTVTASGNIQCLPSTFAGAPAGTYALWGGQMAFVT